jgi:hypothetical protein
VLEGTLVLCENDGETVLKAGDAAGFKAGVPNGHCLINRSGQDAVYLEVGTRAVRDEADYPDVDLHVRRDESGLRYTRKSGAPYAEGGQNCRARPILVARRRAILPTRRHPPLSLNQARRGWPGHPLTKCPGAAMTQWAAPRGRNIPWWRQGGAERRREAYVIALEPAARIWSRPHSPVPLAWLVTKST